MEPLPSPRFNKLPRVMDPAAHRRRVVALALPGGDPLELVGPLEILSTANLVLESAGHPELGYDIEVVAPTRGVMFAWKGLKIVVETTCHELRGEIDTIIIQAMDPSGASLAERSVLRWLARVSPHVRRVSSVCNASYVLAEAGLLEGRRATTHWAFCEDFSKRYPGVTVDPAPIFVQDGNVYTSAGATSGLDMTLAFVEQDFGREVALRVAQYLVFFLKRPGNQAQFSVQMAGQLAERDTIREIQTFVYENIGRDLSIMALAKKAAMSPRNFARVFTQETGVTPGKFVEDARLEIARERLEQSRLTVEETAAACGYKSAETMRQAFIRAIGVSPSEYRRRFATSGMNAPAEYAARSKSE